MKASLWKTPDGSWAVCEGPGPTGVKGYVEFKDGWRIVPDTSGTVYMNPESAAAKVLGVNVPETDEYILSKDGELRSVRTYPDNIVSLTDQGWKEVAHPVK